MSQDKIKQIKEELNKFYNWFNKGAYQWSFVYHLCLYSSLISTLLIGFLSQFNDLKILGFGKDIVVSFLAFSSAVLTGIIAKGGLDRKWKSNRINRGKVEGLQLDLIADETKYPEIIKKLKEIITDHDKVIVGVNLEMKEEKNK